jgi:hypothetical protein
VTRVAIAAQLVSVDDNPARCLVHPMGGRYHPATMRMLSTVVAVLVVGGALFAAGAAQAQRKKITLDDIVVEGNIQKPEAFFILPRTNLNFNDLDRREDLKSKIVKSVEKEPF